jgi:molybdopterin-guanine dinucleotide biosynthesis protein A
MTERIAALVLAGGEGRRMGGVDKPLLDVGGRPMLAAVIASLGVVPTAISANGDPARFAAFGLPVFSDGVFQGHGPLAGILAGLRWAASLGMTALLTAPGDMPFLPPGLVQKLATPPRSVRVGGRTQHLVALWPSDCADLLHTFLSAKGSRRVADFSEQIGMQYDEFPVELSEAFDNINTHEQLARARQFVGQMKPRDNG